MTFVNMKIAAIICVVVAVISCCSSATTSVKFAFKDVARTPAQQNALLIARTNDEMKQTFKLVDVSGYSKRLSFWLCLDPTGSMTVDVEFNIRYSNEADIDTIRVYFAGTLVNQIQNIVTTNWDAFSLSDTIGSLNGNIIK